MEKTGWKTLAIVALCLLVMETFLVGYIYKIGSDEINNEELCMYDICDDELHNSYHYENDICYCYSNGEIEHSERLG